MGAKSAGKLPEDTPKRAFSKSDARYWLLPGRLFKDHGVADYSCRFSDRGIRAQVCLNTANQRESAKRAADLFKLVAKDGWDAGFALYRPKTKDRNECTVGDLIVAACRMSTARRHSLDGYTKAFRRVVSEIRDIRHERNYNAHGGGSAEWRAKVDAVPLASITPADVVAWKNRRLREAEVDPLAKRRAIVTVNSLIRNAKALFGKKILPFIEQSSPLPRPLPFDGVTMEKSPSMRYVSKIDPYAILAKAKQDVAEPDHKAEPGKDEPEAKATELDHEAFKALVLALVCGLRRSEIDNLLWRSFDFTNSKLRVENTEYHQLKSEDSAGEIDLDADTLALFRGWRAKSPTAVFVIDSPNPPRINMKARCYRCDAVFKGLLAWLRAKGVPAAKPLHTLRKEIGSVIASEHGIFEASRYLRHSDIRITSAFYADKKKIVTPKAFAGLLGPDTGGEPSPFPSAVQSCTVNRKPLTNHNPRPKSKK